MQIRNGNSSSLKETKITKIGSKYIEVEDNHIGRFFKDTLIHDAGKYTSCYKLYLCKEDYEIELEIDNGYKYISDLLQNKNIDIIKIRKIINILKS